MIKKLIVNADDFGLSEGVCLGILKAHRDGILTSTTCMMNMENIEKYLISVLPFFLWQEPLHPVPEPHDQIPQGIEAMVVLFYRYFSALI